MRRVGIMVGAGLIAISVGARAESISCKEMETMATNTAQQAYEETRNHVELVSQIGLFDVWMMLTAQLIQSYKIPDNSEFIATTRIAGKLMIEEKSQIIKTISPEGYVKLFGRLTFRTCDSIEQQG